MKTKVPRKLTLAELSHLSALLGAEQETGCYYGSREQYYARTQRLVRWCSQQIKALAEEERFRARASTRS